MCLAQGRDSGILPWLKPAIPCSRVKHSNTEPPMCISVEQYEKTKQKTNERWHILPGVVVTKANGNTLEGMGFHCCVLY